MTDAPDDGKNPPSDGRREPFETPSEAPATVEVKLLHSGPKADLKILPTPDGSLRLAGPRGGSLTPFRKGQVANPGGGRKQKEIHAAYARFGSMSVAEFEAIDLPSLTVFEMAAYREINRSLYSGTGKMAMTAHAAMVELSDRTDGKVAQKIYASQGISEELDELSDDELKERVKQLREKNT
jgi:hypothetical protein